jgi:hypothetical protein
VFKNHPDGSLFDFRGYGFVSISSILSLSGASGKLGEFGLLGMEACAPFSRKCERREAELHGGRYLSFANNKRVQNCLD